MDKIKALCVGTTGDCVKDAKAFGQFVMDRIGQDPVSFLLKSAATKKQILYQFAYYGRELSAEDTLIFYFAGHTKKQTVPENCEVCKTTYAAQYERCDRKDKNYEVCLGVEEEDGKDEIFLLYGSELLDNELLQALDKIKATKLCVIDSCFAGGAHDNFANCKTIMHFFCSSTEAQRSWDGTFTPALLDALQKTMTRHEMAGSKILFNEGAGALYYLDIAFKQIKDKLKKQKPVYKTNRPPSLEYAADMGYPKRIIKAETSRAFQEKKAAILKGITSREEKEVDKNKGDGMAKQDKKQLKDRKGNTLPTYQDVDGVVEKLDGVQVGFSWKARCNDPEHINVGYRITPCNPEDEIIVVFPKATPKKCLEIIRDRLLPDLGIKLFGQDNMEMGLDKVTYKIQGWCRKPFGLTLENPTKEDLALAILDFFDSLSMVLKFQGEEFKFGKVGSVGIDGARKGGSGDG